MDFTTLGGQVTAPGWVAAPPVRQRARSPSPQANSFQQQPTLAGAPRAHSPMPPQRQSPTVTALSFGGSASARGPGVASAMSGSNGDAAAVGLSHSGVPLNGTADVRLRPPTSQDYVSAPKVLSLTQVPKVQMQELQLPLSPMGPLSPMRARSPTPVRMQSSQSLTTSMFTQATPNSLGTPGMPLSSSVRTHTASTVTMPTPAVPTAALSGTAVKTMVSTPSVIGPMRTQAGVPIYQMPPVSLSSRAAPSASQMVAVPLGTLTHIDNIVSEMERELTEIRATEVWQDVLDLKEKHLSQLRRILAEDLLYDSEDRDEGPPPAAAKASRGRLTMLESDHLAMRKQVSELEQKHGNAERDYEDLIRVRAELEAEIVELKSVAEAERLAARLAEQSLEAERLAARRAEQSLADREAGLAREQQFSTETREAHMADVRKLEAALEQERLSSAEAREARAIADEDLQKLEANFRAMMDDCQALQVKIQEVTAERDQAVEAERLVARDGISAAQAELSSRLALLEETQKRIAELEEESNGHQHQVKLHRTRTGELEVQVGDLHSELQVQRGHHETKDKRIQALLDEIAGHTEQYGKHRSRLQELEKQLLETKDENEGHVRQHATNKLQIGELQKLLEDAHAEAARHQSHARNSVTHRARVQELETELLSAQADKDNHHRNHVKRIADLEIQLEELRLADQNHSRQHATNRGKIQDLERLLAERESAESNHTRQHSTNRTRIKELEQQLLDLQTSHDNHVRQNKDHRRRVTELQQELENGRFSEGEKARLDKVHRAALADLQNQLNSAETEQKKYLQQSVGHRQRLTELEAELTLLRDAETNHQRMHGAHKKRIKDMEDELTAQETHHTRKHGEMKIRMEELTTELDGHRERVRELEIAGPPLGLVEELDGRVAALMQELAQTRDELAKLRRELDVARLAAETVQRDADTALHEQESLLRIRTIEMEEKLSQASQATIQMEEKLSQANRSTIQMEEKLSHASQSTVEMQERLSQAQKKIHDLEGQLARRESQRAVEPAPSTNSSQNYRKSLVGQVAQRRVELTGILLPDSNDAFVVKVRTSCKAAGDALRVAADVNARCVRAEIEKMLEDSRKGTSLKSAVGEFSHRAEMISERQAAADLLQSSISDLRACREELEIQHQLEAENQKEAVLARIDLDIERCQDELALLDSSNALEELPEVILQGLLDLHVPGATPTWTDGFSPMHWAAHHGRQDLIEYLVSIEGGRALLEIPDSRGHAPLYYAQLGSRKALVIWLTEELGTKAPVHTHQQTPAFSHIPESYQKVLVQIRTHGWRLMSWRDGYTMLHWAANKGHQDVCEYLVGLDADPNKADGHGRTPIDIARNNGNQELVNVLQDLRSQRRASRRVNLGA